MNLIDVRWSEGSSTKSTVLNLWRSHAYFSPAHWPALDLLKALGVFVILFVHPHFLLISKSYGVYAPGSRIVSLTEDLMVFGTLITLLPILAGCGLRMSAAKFTDVSGKLNSLTYIRSIFWISVALSTLGFMMNALTWGSWYTFSWNMLQMISVSFLLIVLVVTRFGLIGLTAVALLTLVSGQPLAELLRPYNDNYFVGVVAGNESRFIFWPLFPWVSLPILGFVCADIFIRVRQHFWGRFAFLTMGLGTVVAAIARNEFTGELNYRYVWTQLMIQPPILEVLSGLGLFLILIVLAEWLTPRIQLRRYGIVNCYSKGILWIYLLQMIVSYHLAPHVIELLDFRSRMQLASLTDALAYSAFPLFMLLFGWLVGFASIKLFQESRFRITLRKGR